MADLYQNFAALSLKTQESVDYRILARPKETTYGIFAPHGGYIERATGQIANSIAGEDHCFYCFEGLKPQSKHLHITSNHFDEPTALCLINQVNIVITFHGAYGNKPCVYFGGLHEELKQLFIDTLNHEGFKAGHDPSPTRQGKAKTNICNRGTHLRGVQVEMTQGFRKSLFDKPVYKQTNWQPNDQFTLFVDTIRKLLSSYPG